VGARETVDAIIRSASAFAGGKIDDDVTVVVMDFEEQPKEKKR
jgi:serine phosphatase RsbU (regulator of sigma subunit)